MSELLRRVRMLLQRRKFDRELVVALAACYVPARKSLRIAPAVALRQE